MRVRNRDENEVYVQVLHVKIKLPDLQDNIKSLVKPYFCRVLFLSY